MKVDPGISKGRRNGCRVVKREMKEKIGWLSVAAPYAYASDAHKEDDDRNSPTRSVRKR